MPAEIHKQILDYQGGDAKRLDNLEMLDTFKQLCDYFVSTPCFIDNLFRKHILSRMKVDEANDKIRAEMKN